MVKQRAVVFDDFSGGEFGSLGSWDAPKGSFTGQNVMRYVDGSLGPRNGLKQYTLTGVTADDLWRFGIALADKVWFVNDVDGIYTFDPTSMAAQAITSVGSAGGGAAQAVNVGAYVYFITNAAGIRRIDFTTPAITAVASSPNGSSLVRYGERLVAGGDTAHPNRLYYSAAGDADTWSAANYIDVGVGDIITALVPIRNGLAIATARFYSGTSVGEYRWWVLTGVPGVNETLREVVRAQAADIYRSAALLQDGRIAFVAPHAEVIAFFDGSTTRLLRHLPMGTKDTTSSWTVSATRDEEDVLEVSDISNVSNGAYGYFRRAQTWLKQAFSEANVSHQFVWLSGFTADLAIFGDKSATPKFYSWQAYNDRPPFSSDTYASVLDPAAVYFTLPDIQAERGEQIAVRKVTVWFRDWDTGGSANQFNVKVTPIRQYEAGDGTTQTATDSAGATPSFSRAVGSSSASGVTLRRDFLFAEDFGDAARLKISDMRGVAIHRIEVILDSKPELA